MAVNSETPVLLRRLAEAQSGAVVPQEFIKDAEFFVGALKSRVHQFGQNALSADAGEKSKTAYVGNEQYIWQITRQTMQEGEATDILTLEGYCLVDVNNDSLIPEKLQTINMPVAGDTNELLRLAATFGNDTLNFTAHALYDAEPIDSKYYKMVADTYSYGERLSYEQHELSRIG